MVGYLGYVLPTSRAMSQMERHLRMLEKLGLRSQDFWLNTNTQARLPEKEGEI